MSDPHHIVTGGCTNPDPKKLGLEPLPESPWPARHPRWFTRLFRTLRLQMRRPRSHQQKREMLESGLLRELRRAAYSSSVPAYVSAHVLASRLGVPISVLQPILDDLIARQVVVGGLTPGTYGVGK